MASIMTVSCQQHTQEGKYATVLDPRLKLHLRLIIHFYLFQGSSHFWNGFSIKHIPFIARFSFTHHIISMPSDKNNLFESNDNTEEYSQSEEEDFMVGMSAEQRVG